MPKARESGMPDEAVWRTFFSPADALLRLGLRPDAQTVVDFGCGYGTFAVPAAQMVKGSVLAFDLEPAMVDETCRRTQQAGLSNLKAILRDFVADGTGLPDASADYVMVFNILHAEDPMGLLREAHRILRPKGIVGIMHWVYDSTTPRGPPMDIRPKPEDCRRWAESAGFVVSAEPIDLPPFHYGFIARKL